MLESLMCKLAQKGKPLHIQLASLGDEPKEGVVCRQRLLAFQQQLLVTLVVLVDLAENDLFLRFLAV